MKPAKQKMFAASSPGEARADNGSKNVENFRSMERRAIDRWENEGGEILKPRFQEMSQRTGLKPYA